MKLEVLGTNAAFAKEGVNNSFILWDNDGLGILLDCCLLYTSPSPRD